MTQCVQKRVKAAVVISAGFAETDKAGIELEAEIVRIARQGDMRFVGPNCIGHADLYTKVGALGVAGRTRPGPLALLSQSGTVSASIMQAVASVGIGLSKFVSTGNEADLRMVDYLEHVANDERTRVIAAYIEGIREGRRFFDVAKRTTPHKPIVLIKTGNTDGAGKAARSHTGALAGSDAVHAALFKQTGIIQADDEEGLCDIVLALLSQPLPHGNRVGILTIGGGFGVMAAEACEREGLKMAPLSSNTLSKLDALLPPRWSHGNPVDMVGVKTMDEYSTIMACLRAMVEDEDLDSVLAVVANRGYAGDQFKVVMEENERKLKDLGQLAKQKGKPLLLVRRSFAPPSGDADPADGFEDRIPEYPHVRRAARVLGRLVRYGQFVADKRGA